MMWSAIKWGGVALATLLLGIITPLEAAAADNPRLFFVALAGTPVEGKAPVLLRWYITDGPQPVEQFAIYRKPGDAASNGLVEPVDVPRQRKHVQ